MDSLVDLNGKKIHLSKAKRSWGCWITATLAVGLGGFLLFQFISFFFPKKQSTNQKIHHSGKQEAVVAASAQAMFYEAENHFRAGRFLEAHNRFKQAGEAGESNGWYQAGLMAFDGHGIPKNYSSAAIALGKAFQDSETYMVQTAWRLAWLYEQGLGVAQDSEFAFELRQFALNRCEIKDKETHAFLGDLWASGKTGYRDYLKASYHFKHAEMYEKALYLLTKGAADGDPKSIIKLGSEYMGGQLGLTEDIEKARNLFRKAGELGYGEGWLKLYSHQDKDSNPNVEFIKKSVEAKFPSKDGMDLMGDRLIREGSYTEGIAWIEKAIAIGARGTHEYAKCFEIGKGVERDLIRAARIYEKLGSSGEAKNTFLMALQEKQPGATAAYVDFLIRRDFIEALPILLDRSNETEPGIPNAIAHFFQTLYSCDEPSAYFSDKKAEKEFLSLQNRLYQRAAKGSDEAIYSVFKCIGSLSAFNKREGFAAIVDRLSTMASHGNVDAMLMVAWVFTQPEYFKPDRAIGYGDFLLKYNPEEWDQSIYTDTLIGIGKCYLEGKGLNVDFAKARRYFQRAANVGNAGAWQFLSDIHREGLGVTKDPVKASYCLGRARFFDRWKR